MRVQAVGSSVWRAIVLLVCLLLVLAPARAAAATTTTKATAADPASFSNSASDTYALTLVARSCPNYSDIMANRARNDIQESLQDLGQNSVYSAGEPVSPTIEEPNDPNCTPLNGVTFTLGAGIVKGSQQYSTVTTTDPSIDDTSQPTASGTPLLDDQGNPTGQTIDGAVNYTLNAAQAQRSASSDMLWIQGGTPTAPLPLGGVDYGFGALRCAIDNLNGDNVEWLGFPAGTPAVRHVFCYAYYVYLPPAQGTMVIKKVIDAPSDLSQDFAFASNATYNPNGQFTLPVTSGNTAQTSFVRAVSSSFGAAYTFAEIQPSGWTLEGVVCDSTSATVGPAPDYAVSIDLQADATVTCTWTDQPPQTAGLTVRKETVGGVGTFAMQASSPSDPASPYALSATTTEENSPVLATGLPATVPAGTWTLSETLPTAPDGTWALTDAYCTGQLQAVTATNSPAGVTESITVDLAVGGNEDCTFVNTFTPNGSITLSLVTEGGTGTGAFVISSATPPQPTAADDAHGLNQSATTTAPSQAAVATGDPSNNLPLETYAAVSTAPQTTTAGTWSFVSFICTGGYSSPAPGSVEVTLTSASPDATCTATYQLIPASTLQVTKQTSGPQAARTGAVIVTVNCGDGSNGQVVGPAGAPGPFSLPTLLAFTSATTCTVAEPATGAAPGATVATSATLASPAGTTTLQLPATVTIAVGAAQAYTVTVSDVYTAATLPDTGGPGPGGLLVPGFGLLLIGLGAGVIGLQRRRRSV